MLLSQFYPSRCVEPRENLWLWCFWDLSQLLWLETPMSRLVPDRKVVAWGWLMSCSAGWVHPRCVMSHEAHAQPLSMGYQGEHIMGSSPGAQDPFSIAWAVPATSPWPLWPCTWPCTCSAME